MIVQKNNCFLFLKLQKTDQFDQVYFALLGFLKNLFRILDFAFTHGEIAYDF